MQEFLDKVKAEREYQLSRGWKDTHNSSGLWVAYIVNYISRWAMPKSFDPQKYDFETCLVKTATLCLAAYEWSTTKSEVDPDSETLPDLVSNTDTK
jgi:hypothetical protein